MPLGPATEQLSRETLKDVKPKKFWAKYISQRRPAVLAGGLEESPWGAAQQWTLDYLAEKTVSYQANKSADCWHELPLSSLNGSLCRRSTLVNELLCACAGKLHGDC